MITHFSKSRWGDFLKVMSSVTPKKMIISIGTEISKNLQELVINSCLDYFDFLIHNK